MKRVLLLLTSVALVLSGSAQVGINILIPDSSAVLQLESVNKGLGLSRLTTPQRDAIFNPLKGLTIFNTQDSVIEYWNGECWLKAWQKNCYECDFTMAIDDPMDTLDRLISDSVLSTITINHTNGTDPISVIYLAVMPQGVSAYFDGNTTIDSNGTLDIVVKADLCAPVSGNVNFIIQAFCGDQIHFLTYNVYIIGPQQFTIPVDQTDYNLQVANALPAGSARHILLDINNGVELHSSDVTIPAYNTGNLAANSIVCINNEGAILGRGGDGGNFSFNGQFLQLGGQPGEAGGNAMNLTTRTVLDNSGAIYGGGSGGSSVGFGITTPSIPIIGSITIGFGYCGGGGSELGAGGTAGGGSLTIGLFGDGNAATGGVLSVPGLGASATTTISIPISIASINITPQAYGGDGGAYGQIGGNGYIDVTIEACVNIPIIGTICVGIPIPGGFLPSPGPTPGDPGLAILRNGHPLTGLPDGSYNTTQVKGIVTP